MAAPIELTPHRAVYALSLDGSKAAKRVESARGEIVYEIKGNACAGYSVSLKQVTTLETDGGGRLSSALTTATWEDGEANAYRYRIENTVNADKREDADGMVERKDGRMMVKATKPKAESFELDGRIVLPTQHVVKILTQAADGDATLEAAVYDGSPDGKKVYDTLAVIGKATTAAEGLETAATAAGLAGRPRYPVVVSYYERGSDSQSPDYIISFDLYDNGVSRNLKLDYGDFVLRGQLTSYEALPAEACAK
ncbi:cell envelope integrity EipB family protein [Bosea sp. 117]|uniref:cell envelope integrity EipB family protein n=1 Tax=Bosea sp. 117 TaxID=1125973 RepID=UPI000A5439B1|nr:cell envelope integrity EipB family protein [Bosea sp. 117]